MAGWPKGVFVQSMLTYRLAGRSSLGMPDFGHRRCPEWNVAEFAELRPATRRTAARAQAGSPCARSQANEKRPVVDEVHEPARRHGAADEQRKTERAEADHHLRLRPLGDAEDDRGEQREQQHRAEVSQ